MQSYILQQKQLLGVNAFCLAHPGSANWGLVTWGGSDRCIKQWLLLALVMWACPGAVPLQHYQDVLINGGIVIDVKSALDRQVLEAAAIPYWRL